MRQIALHARDRSVRAHAVVDAADLGWLARWPWSFDGTYYDDAEEAARAVAAFREHMPFAGDAK